MSGLSTLAKLKQGELSEQEAIKEWAESLLELHKITPDGAHFWGSLRDTAYHTMESLRVPQRLRERVYSEYKILYFADPDPEEDIFGVD